MRMKNKKMAAKASKIIERENLETIKREKTIN